jgi:hypothetical protein
LEKEVGGERRGEKGEKRKGRKRERGEERGYADLCVALEPDRQKKIIPLVLSKVSQQSLEGIVDLVLSPAVGYDL